MKIAFLLELFPCLSETFILNQVTGLIRRGHDVHIFAAMPRKTDQAVHEDVQKYNLEQRTSYFYHGNGRFAIPAKIAPRFLRGTALFMKYLAVSPHAVLSSLNVMKYGREASSLSLFYKTLSFIDKGRFDILYCHFGTIGLMGARFKEVGSVQGKLVTSFHGYDMSQFVRRNGHDVYKPLFSEGDLFLPVSDRWKKELVRLGCGQDKTVVHRMGIDTGKFLALGHKQQDVGHTSILTIARLVEKKGIEYGIRGVAKIIKRHRDVQYTIVGSGPLEAEIRDLIEGLEMKDKITLLGARPQEQIIQLMRDADILLAPSVTSGDGDEEGIPVVLMEAMALGIPVVSTLHSGIPELVQDGESGLLVKERDADAIADRLTYLIENPSAGAKMGEVGREYVRKHHDIERLNDQLIERFRNLL